MPHEAQIMTTDGLDMGTQVNAVFPTTFSGGAGSTNNLKSKITEVRRGLIEPELDLVKQARRKYRLVMDACSNSRRKLQRLRRLLPPATPAGYNRGHHLPSQDEGSEKWLPKESVRRL